jgi:hypothetical protein
VKANEQVDIDSAPATVLAALKHGQVIGARGWKLRHGEIASGEAVQLFCPDGDEEDFPATPAGTDAALRCLREEIQEADALLAAEAQA